MRLLPPESRLGWTPYVWLVYLTGYVASPFLFGASAAGWAVQAAGLAVFVALYFRAFWLEGLRRLPVVGAQALLGVALTPINPGAIIFFVYAAAAAGDARLGRWAGPAIGLVTLAGVATATGLAAVMPVEPWGRAGMIAGVAVFAPLIGYVNHAYAEARRRDAALRLAQEEIARLAALAERDRIAGDLHDLLGHTLSTVVLKAELAGKLLARDPARAAAEVADVERIARESLAEVRRVVHGMHAATLSDEIARARLALDAAGVRADIDAGDVPAHGPLAGLAAPEPEHAIGFVLREAVTNVLRHARATRCRITVRRLPGALHLHVEDDGVGGAVVEGSGLRGMRARVEALGGRLDCAGRGGVSIDASVPLKGASS